MTRQILAFILRDWQLVRRNWTWAVVYTLYAMVASASVALIGVAAGSVRLTLTLVVGVLLWTFLSVLFYAIAMSMVYERWEDTIEYTFMAPVSRLVHLSAISLFAITYAIVRVAAVVLGLMLFLHFDIRGANLAGIGIVLASSSFAFIGLALIAATFPLVNPEHGAEGANIFQSVLLLVSGIYYPVSVLPRWLQPLAAISPATYALRAVRKLIGVDSYTGGGALLKGAPLADVLSDVKTLLAMGLILVPLGLFAFNRAEARGKRSGKLKRGG